MAECDYENWGVSKTSKETLDEYWDALLYKADHNEEEEIKFFLHCTSLTGRKKIETSGGLIGGYTNLPARAPLASYDGLRGIWLAPSPKELPTRSPYGTQRMVFKVRSIINYLRTFDESRELDEDDRWDAPESTDQDAGSKGKGKKDKGKAKDKKKAKQRGKNQPQPQSKRLTKHDEPRPRSDLPLLFFECAHFYGNNQYVRLLLVRASDPKAEWCKEFCKQLDFRNNPFLCYRWGRLFTYSGNASLRTRDVMVEVLVVGDIVFEKLEEPPDWDEVGTIQRAGFDPRLGIC